MAGRVTSSAPTTGTFSDKDGVRALTREPARVSRRRRKGMLALAVVMIGLGCLIAYSVVTSLSDRTSVIVLARDVPVGAALAGGDLATSMVSVDPGVQTIPGHQLDEVIGKIAATDLKHGTLLASSELTAQRSPAHGQQIVPVALTPSQIPARGLRPGDHVLVVTTQAQAGATGSQQPEPDTPSEPSDNVAATVDQVGRADADGKVVVDLLVAAQAGPRIARQAAAGRIALLVTPRSR